jgi:hypothetical protein
MARISDLPLAGPITGDETVPVVQGEETFRTSITDLLRDSADVVIGGAADSAAEAVAAAQIASAVTGPIYATIALGLGATDPGDEFAVNNNNGTASIYINEGDVESDTPRIIPLDPSASITASLIGTEDGNLQAVLNNILSRIAALEP